MGYYTAYDLSFDMSNPEIVDAVHDKLEELQVIHYALTDNFECNDCVSWYNHDDDMLMVSRAFPDIHFVLYGKGSESEDIWEAHYVGGKMAKYYAQIIIPPFNPDDLR